MSQQIINVGSAPNDGTGDVLRSSQIKANANFTELYNGKVDKITGKGLSENDFTDADKAKLTGIEAGAQVNVNADFGENDPSAPGYILNRPPSMYASVVNYNTGALSSTSTDKAETGKTVSDFVNLKLEPFNEVIRLSDIVKKTFTLSAGELVFNGFIGTSTNWLNAKDISVTAGEIITLKGFSANVSSIRCAFYNSTTQNQTTFISSIPVVLGATSQVVTAPAGALSMAVNVVAETNAGASPSTSPYKDTLKIYTGSIEASTLKAEKIVGEIQTPQIQEIEAETFTNRFFDGNGAPSSTLGNNGDKYFDKSTLRIYTKSLNSWGNGYFLGGESDFAYPSDFTYRPFDLYRQSNKIYAPKGFKNIRDQFVQSYIDTLTPYYVDSVSGSNSNSGLSLNMAFKTITHAVTSGARLIYIIGTDGFIDRGSGFGSISDIATTSPLIIIGIGNVIFGSSNKGSTFTWVLDGNCYKTTRSVVQNIFDFDNIDSNGFPSELLQVGTSAECQTTPNSWCIEGSTLFVRKANGTAPNNKLEISIAVTNDYTPTVNVPFIYFENIGFATNTASGSILIKNSTTTQFNTKAYFYNCYGFKNKLGNIFSIDNIKECWIQNCRAYKPKNDGFNYHTSKTGYVPMKVVEINNYAEEMGKDFPAETSSNGSTIHEGGTILRINCTYKNGRGGVIADVNAGVKSLNLNVKSSGNYSSTGGSFLILDANSKMWLYDCVGNQDLATQYSANTASGANLYYKNSEFNQQLIGPVTPL